MNLPLGLHCCIAALNEFSQPFIPLIEASMSRETTHKEILFLLLTFYSRSFGTTNDNGIVVNGT